MEDSGNKMKIDFAKKNEKIEHCGCASRLKIAIFVGSFQFSSRFISIDPWKFTNFITGKDQFIFFNDPNAAHCAMLKNFRRSFCLLLADLVVLFKKSAAQWRFAYIDIITLNLSKNSKSQENCLILLSPNEKRRKNWYNLKLDCFKAKFMFIKE